MEFTDYVRFILVLVFVLGLVFLLAWALKRFGYGGVIGKMQSRRLRVVETALLGPKHRLVLVRRDESGWGAFVALIATLPVLFLLGVTVFAA